MKLTTMMKPTILFISLVLLVSSFVLAQPSGTNIIFNETNTVAASPPDVRTDDGGTINTLVIDAIQQNPNWKAYVGNITGSLTLDDSDGNTIFNWVLDQSSISGEVFSSRSNSVDWSSISCAGAGLISTEDSTLGIDGNVDSITNTFNETSHPNVRVDGAVFNTCFATSTFVNSNRQAIGTSDFPVVLLGSSADLVYATPINPATTGYDGVSSFDFQMILGNNRASSTTYYFYVELTG